MSGAGCPSSPSPSSPGWWPSPRSSTRRPRSDGAGAGARASGTSRCPCSSRCSRVVILFSTIFTFSDFNIVYVLTQRRADQHHPPLRHALATRSASRAARSAQGAAISLFLFPLLVMVVFFQLRYVRKSVLMMHGPQPRRAPRSTRVRRYCQPGAVPVLRAVPLLFHDADLAEVERASSTTVKSVPFWIQHGRDHSTTTPSCSGTRSSSPGSRTA